ncbi:DNA repair protein [Babesia ovata]|uniref:DNA repair protein n=1 Tax=Babesia ovata TaxID=189622 RepID=A0A2H6KA52_9APIC|nr:DNA repair protein [Babesia ovata]GBE59877.1 DNA repair protein [Babesia ovata]
MQPLPFEKAILRRFVPTWQELVCQHIAQGVLTRADLSIEKCRKRRAKGAGHRKGVTNALLILSPGTDCSRLLFYLLLYVVNPLHVYDSDASECRVEVSSDLPRQQPPLCLQNAELALRSRKVYHGIFDLASGDGCDAADGNGTIIPHVFQNLKLRSAVEVGNRLILILGLGHQEAVSTARQFAHLVKNLCHSTSETPNNMCVKIPQPRFIDGTVVAQEREKMYIEGGIFGLPPRILLVDLLTAKLAPELVSGIIIVNAHRMMQDYNIPFLIKLLRTRNRLAFIKAMTDNVVSLREGRKLSFILKSLFTADCFIFPRCSSCYDRVLNDPSVQPETFEMSMHLSDGAKQIHQAIVQVLQRLVADMQRQGSQELQKLDMNTIMYTNNVKTLLVNALQRAHIPNEFHVKRTMMSITNLRMLLDQLINMDALSFLNFAEDMKMAESESHWLWTPLGATIYKLATARVYEPSNDTEAGLKVNMELDQKGECIRRILGGKYVGCEELGELLRTAMNWHASNRPFRGPSRYKTAPPRVNISLHWRRRCLCRREARHIRRICRFFECGGVISRRAIVVTDNNFLQSHLNSSLTMSLKIYNERKFMVYAARRADRFEYADQEERKFSGYAQAHFHRSMVNSRKETDKLLHRFVVWSKYNEIYQAHKDRNGEGSPEGQKDEIALDDGESTVDAVGTYGEMVDAAGDFASADVEFGNPITLDEAAMDSPAESAESDSDIKAAQKVTSSFTIPTTDNTYMLTINISKMVNCKARVINVSQSQTRSEMLKGIMERKLLSDDADEPVPLNCSHQEFLYVLQRLNPTVVVVCRPNVKVFRVIEQYCALRAASGQRVCLRVYVLSYRDCIESHKFARDLKHELGCWKDIQQELKTLQVTFDESVLLSNVNGPPQLAVPEKLAVAQSPMTTPSPLNTPEKAQAIVPVTSQAAGGAEQGKATTLAVATTQTSAMLADMLQPPIPTARPSPQVVIDMREFNSKLPFHLYYKGVQLLPMMLEMGDYLLTRDICVERKSLSDLVSSLGSGRLAQQVGLFVRNKRPKTNQAEELCSVYDLPFLLLEFDDAESFHLSPCNEQSTGINYIYSKLCILCCNYPKLRLIWSQSPESSAAIFVALKRGRGEPDAATNDMLISQARCGAKDGEGSGQAIVERRRPEDVNNRDALRILRKIPGVTSYNVSEILSRVTSLRHLSEMEEADLCQFLPEANSHAIYNFFNQRLRTAVSDPLLVNVQQSQVVTFGDHELLPGGAVRGFPLRIGLIFNDEHVGRRHYGYHGQNLRQALLSLAGDHHLAQGRFQRVMDQLPAGVGELPEFVYAAQNPQLQHCAQDVLHVRRVDEVELGEVLHLQRFQQQHHVAEVGPPDFGYVVVEQVVQKRALSVQAVANAGRSPPRPTGTLVGAGLAHGSYLQAVHTHLRVVHLQLAEAAVDHEFDTVQRKGGFCDVGGHNHLAIWVLLEDTLLQLAGQLAVYREYAERLHEDQNVTRALGDMERHALVDCRLHVVVAHGPHVLDPDGECAAGDFIDRTIAEELGELVTTTGNHGLQDTKQNVGVQAAFVRLVHDNAAVTVQLGIHQSLTQQDTVRHKLYRRVFAREVLETDRVPDEVAHPRAHLGGYTLANGYGGNPTRLGAADDASLRVARLVQKLGQLRRLTGTRLSHNDHHLKFANIRQQLLSALENR